MNNKSEINTIKVKLIQSLGSCHLFIFPFIYCYIPQCRKLELYSHTLFKPEWQLGSISETHSEDQMA